MTQWITITETPVRDDIRAMLRRSGERAPSVRCPRCGRFARWDAYEGRWWCELDQRAVKA